MMIRVPGAPAPSFPSPGVVPERRERIGRSTFPLYHSCPLDRRQTGRRPGPRTGKQGSWRRGSSRQRDGEADVLPLDQAPPARSGLMDCKPWGKKARPLSWPGFSFSDVRSALVARLFPTALGTLRAHPYASRGYCPRSTPCGSQRRSRRGSSSTPQ